MSKLTGDVGLTSLSFWAVGRVAEAAEIAMKLNDFPPVLMSPDNAREIAEALTSEANAVAPRGRRPPVTSSSRAARK
jgi:hypothetical protein